ncbi:MAG: peptidase M16, partial [Bacteroidetes bacterium QS_8_68_15]
MLEEFEEKTTTFTLDNGLTFVVVERHDAPVVSFHTYADVGAVDEPMGQSGLAHLFEHLAFKGTTTIGTTDIQAEMASIEREEEIFAKIERERARGPRADTARIGRLQTRLDSVEEQSKEYLSDAGYDQLLDRNGVNDLNAYTGADQTGYVYSLPSNKLELFFALESDRFMNPVFREFYTERDVVMEERRQRTESTPTGRLLEEFTATAFGAHPYGVPTIGHMSDLESLSRADARAFFEKYYGPSNLTIGIAGDVDPQRARELAEKYFSRLEGGEEPMGVATEEPEQISERRVIIREQSQPIVLMGWHRPSMFSEDAAVYDVLQDVLTQGRTSRLHKALIEEEKALQVQALPAYPGSKYPTLFGILGVPNREVGPEQLEEDIYAV